MAVSIVQGPAVYSLTSPPETPKPKPPSKLIAEEMVFADRSILVTVPFPDTIELTADVLDKHSINPSSKGGSAKAIYKELDNDLMAMLTAIAKGEALISPKPYVKTTAKAEAIFEIEYDPSQPLHRGRLSLTRTPGADYGSWRVRLEFSPMKAGPAGLVKLTAGFEDALPFSFAQMLPDLRVSRLDPAIDLIGAHPLDLIAHVPKPGKRQVFVGDDGRPESIYLYERKKPLVAPPPSLGYNTRGPLRLKLYERRNYLRQFCLQPTYGPCPVTRVETEVRWKKKEQRPYLASLPAIGNLFEGRRVAYAAAFADDTSSPAGWVEFCLAAFGGGVGTAQWKWPSTAQGLAFRKLYEECAGDLVSSERWAGWSAGLKATGLDSWIKLAIAKS